MSKTYLFAGASSAIAQSACEILRASGNTVIGISTKNKMDIYSTFYETSTYDFNSFPEITETIDGLVYFPGTINLKPFGSLKQLDFETDLRINTLGAVAFCQKYLPNLKLSSNGSIVFISTVAVQLGMPFHSSISMAKGAIEGLCLALAAELAPKIRVNCVAPSLFNSPLSQKFLTSDDKTEQLKLRNPMKKIGSPSEIAKAICFLLSNDSSWITGQIIAVDGGMNHLKT